MKEPDFSAKYLRWIFENITPEHAGTYGMDDVIDTIVVTEVNLADLSALAGRLLLPERPLPFIARSTSFAELGPSTAELEFWSFGTDMPA